MNKILDLEIRFALKKPEVFSTEAMKPSFNESEATLLPKFGQKPVFLVFPHNKLTFFFRKKLVVIVFVTF